MNATVPERKTIPEEISGLIERVTFHNDENGFCVLRVKVRGQRDEVTVLGSLPSVTAGEWLEAEGWWVRDKEHGLQFKATLMKTIPPTAVEGIAPLTRTKANCLPSGENAGPQSCSPQKAPPAASQYFNLYLDMESHEY